MTQEYDNVLDAKRSIKRQIEFLENLLNNLKGANKIWRGHAVVTAWCIDRYFNGQLQKEIHEVLAKNMPQENTSEIIT
jgi:hypothetical protein